MVGLARHQPGGNGLDIILGHRAVVFEAQQVFQHHLHRTGELGNTDQAVLFRLENGVIGVGLAADRQRRL